MHSNAFWTTIISPLALSSSSMNINKTMLRSITFKALQTWLVYLTGPYQRQLALKWHAHVQTYWPREVSYGQFQKGLRRHEYHYFSGGATLMRIFWPVVTPVVDTFAKKFNYVAKLLGSCSNLLIVDYWSIWSQAISIEFPRVLPSLLFTPSSSIP